MKKRIELQKILLGIGSEYGLTVYYQPPSNHVMTYPCLVYEPVDSVTFYANDVPYLNNVRYQVTLITKDPDPESFEALLSRLPYGSFRNKTVSDNLHNFVFYCYK